jgi:hypothetical protein
LAQTNTHALGGGETTQVGLEPATYELAGEDVTPPPPRPAQQIHPMIIYKYFSRFNDIQISLSWWSFWSFNFKNGGDDTHSFNSQHGAGLEWWGAHITLHNGHTVDIHTSLRETKGLRIKIWRSFSTFGSDSVTI